MSLSKIKQRSLLEPGTLAALTSRTCHSTPSCHNSRIIIVVASWRPWSIH
jgi:hypothetical protein